VDAPELTVAINQCELARSRIESSPTAAPLMSLDAGSGQEVLVAAHNSDTVTQLVQDIAAILSYHVRLPARVGTRLPCGGIRTTPCAGVVLPERAYPAIRAFRWSLQWSTR
jgi:hypothetical protein